MNGSRTVAVPAREVPLAREVDVLVAGAGLSGVFAAIAAGREGAKTLLVDRCSSVGGNLGPGMLKAVTLETGEVTLPNGMAGISAELAEKVNRARRTCSHSPLEPAPEKPFGPNMNNIIEDSFNISFFLDEMLEEAGVEVLLGCAVSEPLREGRRVTGALVETSSGTLAVKAKVVVDGTGEAEIARRAGAKIIPWLEIEEGDGADERYIREGIPLGMIRKGYMNRRYPREYNDTSLPALIAGVDMDAFRRFLENPPEIESENRADAERHFPHIPLSFRNALAKAWREGTYTIWPESPVKGNLSIGVTRLTRYPGDILGFWVSFHGAVDSADAFEVTRLDREMRRQAMKALFFCRENIPGFENAWLILMPPYLGFRGGPRIEGDCTLAVEEMFEETRFDDVIYRNIHESNHGGPAAGYDVPYRVTIPKGVGGMLVCGRGAAFERRGHDPSGMRARPSLMALGQAVGTAAALAAAAGLDPADLPARDLQRRLLATGIDLGEEERLRELGLA